MEGQAAKDKAADDAAINAAADSEIAAGRCSDKHAERLRSILERVTSILSGAENPNGWDLIGHTLVVASDKPSEFSIQSGIGGEIHVFAVSFTPSKLTAHDGQGYPVKTSSPYAELITPFSVPAVGLQALANPRETLTSAVVGHGCVLVFAARRF